jgi:hypothetical protein
MILDNADDGDVFLKADLNPPVQSNREGAAAVKYSAIAFLKSVSETIS